MNDNNCYDEVSLPHENDVNIFDPACDESNPRRLKFTEIKHAVANINGHVMQTPCRVSYLSKDYGMDIYFKQELLQQTGSFKERGACNVLHNLSEEQAKIGVIAASMGNHASGLAYHGLRRKIPVTVVMPTSAPKLKVKVSLSYDAEVLLRGKTISEARRLALKIANITGKTYVNGYDHIKILAGQGTIGLEILDQVPDVDAIIVPVGGGGLIAGIAVAVKHLKPSVLIIGVEDDRCPSFGRALEADAPVYTPFDCTIADGLAVPKVGVNSFYTAKGLVDRMLKVDEACICKAILCLLEKEKVVVEGAGATAFAAIMASAVPDLVGKKVVCILSGGNIDASLLCRIIDRSLRDENRLLRFSVMISNGTSGLEMLLSSLRNLGTSIREMVFITEVLDSRVTVTVETLEKSHAKGFCKTLTDMYPTFELHT